MTIDVRERMTERLLRDAGIGPGMRVLDVGTARGDLALLAARLVGPTGEVVGIDRDPAVLALARERAVANVSFLEGDFTKLEGESFDAVVGRRVLMYQRDSIDAVRKLATLVRPGGVIVFEEADSTMVPASVVPLPLHTEVLGWLWRTVEREGGNVHMGFDLISVFEKAGLTVEEIRAEAVVQRPGRPGPLAAIVRAVMPRIVHTGTATEKEIDIETLERRLAEEVAHHAATYVSDMVFGVWARTP